MDIDAKNSKICFISSKLLLLFSIFLNFSIISFLFLIFSFNVFNLLNIKESSFTSFWIMIFLSSLFFVYLIKFFIYELLIPPNLLHKFINCINNLSFLYSSGKIFNALITSNLLLVLSL